MPSSALQIVGWGQLAAGLARAVGAARHEWEAGLELARLAERNQMPAYESDVMAHAYQTASPTLRSDARLSCPQSRRQFPYSVGGRSPPETVLPSLSEKEGG